LAARSDFFYNMFNMLNSSENCTGVLKVDDMEALLQFIYEGRVAQKELSKKLKIAAEKYSLPKLASRCRNNLQAQDQAPFDFETEYNEDDYCLLRHQENYNPWQTGHCFQRRLLGDSFQVPTND
jgi:hypothetical protein